MPFQNIFFLIVATFVIGYLYTFDVRFATKETSFTLYTDHNTTQQIYPSPVPIFETRNDIGSILEKEGHIKGVELGVQRGYYSAEILKRWQKILLQHTKLKQHWD